MYWSVRILLNTFSIKSNEHLTQFPALLICMTLINYREKDVLQCVAILLFCFHANCLSLARGKLYRFCSVLCCFVLSFQFSLISHKTPCGQAVCVTRPHGGQYNLLAGTSAWFAVTRVPLCVVCSSSYLV